MDILQGNRISAETIDQLELSMSRRQVEFLLGKPAIVDLYHPDTWYYVYYVRSGDDFSKTRKSMKLQFENDLLTEITGDRDLSNPDS
ncbi:MAG: outer membrane protein assembly factor BamE [Gammaproteobacteria bacterium]|nr:outer membrane protein assembly factor BamE [Gammaproteobacteria bacterium]